MFIVVCCMKEGNYDKAISYLYSMHIFTVVQPGPNMSCLHFTLHKSCILVKSQTKEPQESYQLNFIPHLRLIDYSYQTLYVIKWS